MALQCRMCGMGCRKENMTLTAYCLSLLEKDMEQLKRVQAVGALLPMASPGPLSDAHPQHDVAVIPAFAAPPKLYSRRHLACSPFSVLQLR